MHKTFDRLNGAASDHTQLTILNHNLDTLPLFYHSFVKVIETIED